MSTLRRSLLFTACLLLAGTAFAAEYRLVAPRPIVWKDYLGVNAHFLWFSPAQQRVQMLRLKELGLAWTRVDLHWDRHEPEEHRFNFQPIDVTVAGLKALQLKSVFYLVGSAPFASSAGLLGVMGNGDQYPPSNPAQFAERMVMLAKRYPTVDAWQIWNEPNLPSFWRPLPSPAGYDELLQVSVRELSAAGVPKHRQVMAGMAYYSQMPVLGGLMLHELAKLGALDLGAIVAYHPYSLKPEGDEPKDKDFILRARLVNQQLRSMKAAGIWATEWGWSSYPGPVEEQPIIGEHGQADYLLRRLALMSAQDFDRIFLFALSDLDSRATPRDRAYGLLRVDGQPKPAYTALANFLRATGPKIVPDITPTVASAPDTLYSMGWRRDGDSDKRLWMFWSERPIDIALHGISRATLFDPMTGSVRQLRPRLGRLYLTTSGKLQMLEWSGAAQ